MSFADKLRRLRDAATYRERGRDVADVTVKRGDLAALINDFDRVDMALRLSMVVSEDVDNLKRAIAILEQARDGEEHYRKARIISALECLRGQS